MTLNERIEAAARVIYAEDWGDAPSFDEIGEDRQNFLLSALAIVRAAFPELTSSPPTHWPAPWEPTDAMVRCWSDVSPFRWAEVRDAYLNREGK